MLKAKTEKHMQECRVPCKSDYDRHVRETPLFQACNYVIVEKPPSETASRSTTDGMAVKTYYKALRLKFGSWRFSEVGASFVAIVSYSIPIFISVDRIATDPDPKPKVVVMSLVPKSRNVC